MQRKNIRKSLELILKLLNQEQIEYFSQNDQIWIEQNLELMKKVILAHGVGPYLFVIINDKGIAKTSLFSWLEKLFESNVRRIERMHAELYEILLQANRIGIAIMPLKGSLLTTRYYPNLGMRPMADIDLLVNPIEFSGLRSILEIIGYRLINSETTYANHHTFLKPENTQVVSREIEHPDNPRPIEVHTELRRPILGKSGDINLTESIWKNSFTIELLNRKAISPTPEALFTHLTVHAAGHFFTHTGRIMYLLDLAVVLEKISNILLITNPERIYLPLKLASRAFPSRISLSDFLSLEETVDPRIKNWSTHVPLDDRCGLMINTQGPEQRRLQQMLNRWKPAPWRLIFTYGSIPLVTAYYKYALSFLGRSHRLFDRSLPKG